MPGKDITSRTKKTGNKKNMVAKLIVVERVEKKKEVNVFAIVAPGSKPYIAELPKT